MPRCLEDLNTRIRIPGDIQVDAIVFYDNSEPLTKCYNRAIDEIRRVEIEIPTFAVFLHDDIGLADCDLFHKIIESEWDVIGAVGGKGWFIPSGFDARNCPLIWTVASNGRGMSGFMLHHHDGKYMPSSYGETPARTITLDGCFIVLTGKAMQKGLRYDCDFAWHFYDMSLTLSAHRMGLKVGTAPLLLQHESIGESVRQPSFLDSQKKFLKKYFDFDS